MVCLPPSVCPSFCHDLPIGKIARHRYTMPSTKLIDLCLVSLARVMVESSKIKYVCAQVRHQRGVTRNHVVLIHGFFFSNRQAEKEAGL